MIYKYIILYNANFKKYRLNIYIFFEINVMTTKMMIFQRGNNFPGFAVQQHTAKVCLPCGSARQSVFARQRMSWRTAKRIVHGEGRCRAEVHGNF